MLSRPPFFDPDELKPPSHAARLRSLAEGGYLENLGAPDPGPHGYLLYFEMK
jgi:hypothetical protein